jgi:haloalkane dehalogenase
VRAFPELVPTDPEQPQALANERAWRVLERWQKPLLTLFATNDPINLGSDGVFQRLVPGAAMQPHAVLPAGHYLQEDVGPELGQRIARFAGAV